MADKNTIKNWFRTGLKPTQAQFWATWDSFWHKDEKIPITAIDDIEALLNDKADAEAFTNHLTDGNAHAALFAKVRVIGLGAFIIFKRGTATPNQLEPTDLVMGIVENAFITGTYQGGDSSLRTSFTIINQIDF
jgi:hypothetical protein